MMHFVPDSPVFSIVFPASSIPSVWCSYILRDYGCVFCSISLSSVYTCVRIPLSLRSIAGAPSSWALPGFPITAHHLPVRVFDVIGALAVWWQNHNNKKKARRVRASLLLHTTCNQNKKKSPDGIGVRAAWLQNTHKKIKIKERWGWVDSFVAECGTSLWCPVPRSACGLPRAHCSGNMPRNSCPTPSH